MKVGILLVVTGIDASYGEPAARSGGELEPARRHVSPAAGEVTRIGLRHGVLGRGAPVRSVPMTDRWWTCD